MCGCTNIAQNGVLYCYRALVDALEARPEQLHVQHEEQDVARTAQYHVPASEPSVQCALQVFIWHVPPRKSASSHSWSAAPELAPGLHGASIHTAAPPPLHRARREVWANL